MKFGSLFTGIGGFDLGLERSGMSCTWQVEIDKYCNSVLEKHWPSVKRYENVKKVGAQNLDEVDLICGGFPCQDVSIAGLGDTTNRKRAGLSGERSGLWFEFRRIIEEMQPEWIIIENVPGILSSNNGGDFTAIVQGLVELWYGVCWRIFNAKYFGVSQERRRVFIVAKFADIESPKEVLFGTYQKPEILQEAPKRTDRLPCIVGWDGGLSYERLRQCVLTKTNPSGMRENNGISGQLDSRRYRALSNAIVPQIPEWIGKRILSLKEKESC